VLYNCLELYKFVDTHSRQLYNTEQNLVGIDAVVLAVMLSLLTDDAPQGLLSEIISSFRKLELQYAIRGGQSHNHRQHA